MKIWNSNAFGAAVSSVSYSTMGITPPPAVVDPRVEAARRALSVIAAADAAAHPAPANDGSPITGVVPGRENVVAMTIAALRARQIADEVDRQRATEVAEKARRDAEIDEIMAGIKRKADEAILSAKKADADRKWKTERLALYTPVPADFGTYGTSWKSVADRFHGDIGLHPELVYSEDRDLLVLVFRRGGAWYNATVEEADDGGSPRWNPIKFSPLDQPDYGLLFDKWFAWAVAQ